MTTARGRKRCNKSDVCEATVPWVSLPVVLSHGGWGGGQGQEKNLPWEVKFHPVGGGGGGKCRG